MRYLAHHGESQVAKAAIISAVPPLMVKATANPGGLPKSVFDDLQVQLAANLGIISRHRLRPVPWLQPGLRQTVRSNYRRLVRQGMMGGAKARCW